MDGVNFDATRVKGLFEFIPIYEFVRSCTSDQIIPSEEAHAMAAIRFSDVQSCPIEFLDLTRLTPGRL